MRPVAIPRIAQSETEMPPLPDIRSTHCFAPEPNAPRPTKGKRQRVWRRVASGNGEFFADELRIPASPKRIVLDWHYSKPLALQSEIPSERNACFPVKEDRRIRTNESEKPLRISLQTAYDVRSSARECSRAVCLVHEPACPAGPNPLHSSRSNLKVLRSLSLGPSSTPTSA